MSQTIRGLDRTKSWDYENGFYWFSEVRRIAKCYSQLSLYEKIIEVPGDILEFGVYKAASLIRFLSAREMFEMPSARKVIGFDAFGPFPKTGAEAADERQFLEEFEGAGGNGLSIQEVEALLEAKRLAADVSLIKGDIFETLPEYLAKNTNTRVALLHIDVDLYESTKFVLESVWPYVSHGGLVLFDDYGLVGGATRAVDEFLALHPRARLARHRFTNTPTYLIRTLA